MGKEFKICSKYKPSGDQPKAIEQLTNGLKNGMAFLVLQIHSEPLVRLDMEL